MQRALSQQRNRSLQTFSFKKNANNIQILATLYDINTFSGISKEILRKKKKEQKIKSGENIIRKNVPFVTSIIAAADSDASAGWVMLTMGTSPTCSLARDNCTFHTQIS